ncbi:MAG: phosphoserine phosphatase SerB [Devosiaceae bacterium]|nr:phosphoserine phosphatase SerB [Devosiaceae bacterium]
MSVLCLIANPSEPALTPDLIAKVQSQVGGEINWLAQTIACEINSPRSSYPLNIAKEMIAEYPIDVVLLPKENRRKKLLLADMDSTMIEQECIDELADVLGIKEKISDITTQAMNGELDFTQALSTRVMLLKGLDLSQIKQVRRENITLSPGGRVLVKTMKEYGAYCELVSGGFSIFADFFAKRIGFDNATANLLEFDENKQLTGKVIPPIVDAKTKTDRLKTLIEELGISPLSTIAVGDGANDLPMLKQAAMGVALHAKPSVSAAAPFSLKHADLSALLYMQGFNEEEFIR